MSFLLWHTHTHNSNRFIIHHRDFVCEVWKLSSFKSTFQLNVGSTEHFGCLKVRTQCEAAPILLKILLLTEEANCPISFGSSIVYAFCHQYVHTCCFQIDLDIVNETLVSEFPACYFSDPFNYSSPHFEKWVQTSRKKQNMQSHWVEVTLKKC